MDTCVSGYGSPLTLRPRGRTRAAVGATRTMMVHGATSLGTRLCELWGTTPTYKCLLWVPAYGLLVAALAAEPPAPNIGPERLY